jgi:hypothetical protein
MKNNVFTWASAALLLFNVITLQAQTTHTVDNTPGAGAQFTSIQAAINAASNGDTIYVQQSVTPYAGFSLNKQLILVGRGQNIDLFITNITFPPVTLTLGSDGSIIKGFRLSGLNTNSSIVNAGINNITIQDCEINSVDVGSGSLTNSFNNWLFEGNRISAFRSAATVTNMVVQNNFFVPGGSPILTLNPSSFLFTNNIIRLNSNIGLLSSQGSSNIINISNCIIETPGANLSMPDNFQLNNCLLTDYTQRTNIVTINSTATVQNTSGTVNGQDPLFTIPADNSALIPDFTLLPGSPAIGAGLNGGDIGFEAGFIFKRFGNPKGIPEVKLTNFSTIAPQNGTVTFNIEARSH